MAMVATSTAAAWAGWNWLAATDRRQAAGWWFAFWGLLAVGFLAKGPIAWIPIGMAGWTAARSERGKRPGPLQWVLGVALMLALVGIWGIPALIRTHGQFAVVGLGRHVVMRSISPLQGHGGKTGLSYVLTAPYYFLTVWPSFFPWSLWLPPTVAGLWSRRKEWSPRESYLIAGVLLVFGIFTLSWTKLPHYTLPAFPFMALLLAASWERVAYPLFRWTAAAMVAGGLVVTLGILPLARPFFVSQQLYDAAAPYLTPQTELAAFGYEEPSLVWLFRKKIDGFENAMNWRDIDRWMHGPGPRVCVVPTDQLQRIFRHLDPGWAVIKASGFDVANAHRTDLAAVIKR
jgi:4-amino-4-deoxy-L-arabinose transferase-like glycosyltransferase